MNQFAHRPIWPKKAHGLRIFCDTLSGFANFESTADCGLAESFGPDSGLFMPGSSDHHCRCQNEVRITLVGLRRYVDGIVARTSDKTKLVKNWHKNNSYHSLQGLAVKLYHTNFSSNADSDLNKNSGGLTDLAKK